MCVCVCVCWLTQPCLTLCDLWTVAHQVAGSIGFSAIFFKKIKYWLDKKKLCKIYVVYGEKDLKIPMYKRTV